MKNFIPLIIFLIATASYGQQLVYKPVNPNFGGDPFNYQMLLSSADAQNTFKDPSLQEDEQSELDAFKESLNRQLLDQISSQLLIEQLGDDVLAPGTSNFGSLELEVYESSEGLVINILDTSNGDQTQIVVPTN
ncbi:curli production assembly/transport component CsgF [Marixanthomonas ophiurae]|uniref:Curli production assembly/transport component CsgF n=1 Tax=Marixanthomonas ophiurae TaxID=387659 RepID=A0A3E1QCT3_9FLAO|nr:curli production assembly/transport component CsgF [Marixanthomonas ophiurae]RFN59961.1 curli assembly protein CsgF [Marixanthomonas ophiurae]